MPIKKKKKTKSKKKVIKENKKSSTELVIKTKPEWIKSSLASKSKYQEKYSKSIKNNDEFWRKEGKRITWIKPYKKINSCRRKKAR